MADKVIDWQKKYDNLKKSSEVLEQNLRATIEEMNKKCLEFEQKIQDKGKGHTINISAQIHTIKDYGQAQERVRKLLEAGVWYFTVGEKK